MGTASNEPKWWTEDHGTQWGNLKDALKRDWEQTKKDLNVGGKELHQSVGDTLKQAGGGEAIPPWNATGTATGTDHSWDDAEQPLMYGVGAHHQYGAQHAAWNERLEATLKTDWEESTGGGKRKWEDVKTLVQHGYEHAQPRR
jgi:hypothetical protein